MEKFGVQKINISSPLFHGRRIPITLLNYFSPSSARIVSQTVFRSRVSSSSSLHSSRLWYHHLRQTQDKTWYSFVPSFDCPSRHVTHSVVTPQWQVKVVSFHQLLVTINIIKYTNITKCEKFGEWTYNRGNYLVKTLHHLSFGHE